MKSKQIQWQKSLRVLSAALVCISIALILTPPVFAGEYIEGDPNATVAADEVIEDDLFVGGQIIRIEGTIEGDLFATGQEIIISGVVQGNVFAAGQSVEISGEVEGAVMVGAYTLSIQEGALIGRNIYFGGFNLDTGEGSTVGRSIYAGTYQVLINGEVERDVTAGVGAIEVNGHIGGDVTVEIGEPVDGQTPSFELWMPGMPYVPILESGFRVPDENVDGSIDFRVTPVETRPDVQVPDLKVDPALVALRTFRNRAGEFIALLLIGALGLLLAKDWLLKTVEELKAHAPADTGWGLLIFLLYIPVLSLLFLLLITIIVLVSLLTLGNLTGELIALSAITFTGFTTMFGILLGLVSKVVIGYLVGRWLLEKMSKMPFENFWQHFAALALGVFLYEVVVTVPVFGFFITLLVMLMATGAFFVLIREAFRKPGVITEEIVPA